jgi:hypothetical protein
MPNPVSNTTKNASLAERVVRAEASSKAAQKLTPAVKPAKVTSSKKPATNGSASKAPPKKKVDDEQGTMSQLIKDLQLIGKMSQQQLKELRKRLTDSAALHGAGEELAGVLLDIINARTGKRAIYSMSEELSELILKSVADGLTLLGVAEGYVTPELASALVKEMSLSGKLEVRKTDATIPVTRFTLGGEWEDHLSSAVDAINNKRSKPKSGAVSLEDISSRDLAVVLISSCEACEIVEENVGGLVDEDLKTLRERERQRARDKANASK